MIYAFTFILPYLLGFQGDTSAKEISWVVYATEPGWLRVGPMKEFEAEWKKKDEIFGGTSEEPLKKTLVARGYDSHEKALEDLCKQLTDVKFKTRPPAGGGPARFLEGRFREKTYMLRLTKGFDEESAALETLNFKFYKAMEYDWESEWKVLAAHGITPWHIFGRQWLVHSIGHSSIRGWVEEDRWMCIATPPIPEEEGKFRARLADGYGGTIGYRFDVAEGPFVDNYTMAVVMKKMGVEKVDLWPPVKSVVRRDIQPRVHADMIPENPKNYGDEVLPFQPVTANKDLEDWVVYVVEDKWLHLGTRYEYQRPLLKHEVLWGGRSNEPAQKALILPGEEEKITAPEDALRRLVAELTEIRYDYHPNNQPRETISALFRGQRYQLRLDRGETPDFTLERRGLSYSLEQNLNQLHRIDARITPKKIFGAHYLVYAKGHNTYYGYQKDDRWMLINVEPRSNNKFVVPDGIGGTFTYDYSQAQGPYRDSYELAKALRLLAKSDDKLKVMPLWGSRRGVSTDDIPEDLEPIDHGVRTDAPQVTIHKIQPNHALQGDSLGILLTGDGIERGAKLSLGDHVSVKDITYFGRAPDSQAEQWVATVTVQTRAQTGWRKLDLFNTGGSYGSKEQAFEIRGQPGELCPPLEFVVPSQATDWIFTQFERSQKGKRSEAQRDRWLDKFHQIEDLSGEYAQTRQELESLARDLREAGAEAPNKLRGEKLRQWAKLAKTARSQELGYLEAATHLMSSFSEAEVFQLLESLRRRTICLSSRSAAALDDVRTYNYVIHWSEFALRKQLYDIHAANLTKLLEAASACYGGMLLRAQEKLAETRDDLIVTPGIYSPEFDKNLKPHQRRVRDIYLEMGRNGLIEFQFKSEAAAFQQDSYLAAIWAINKEGEKIEWGETVSVETAQTLIFMLKYFLAGTSSLLGTGIDVVKRVINLPITLILGNPLMNTVSAEVTKSIKKGRETYDMAMATLNRIHNYDDERSAELHLHLQGDQGMTYLEDNRTFHEKTSGGILRLASVYESDLNRLMDLELQMTIRHAEMTLRDMKKAFYARTGFNPKGKFERWKRVLTNPMDTIRVLIQNTEWGGDHFSETVAYLGHRESQVAEMEAVRNALILVGYHISDLRRKSPSLYATYLELEGDNPDFLQWTFSHERLMCQLRLDRIADLLHRSVEPAEQRRLQRMQARNRAYLAFRYTGEQARMFQLIGTDKMMVWDYDGALEAFYQASETDPKTFPRKNVETLREALVWQKTVEAGISTASQLGNMGIHTALFEAVGRALGSFIPGLSVGAAVPEALSLKGFANFVWKQTNPFADLTQAALFTREWQEIVKTAKQIGPQVGIQIAQVDLVQKGLLEGWLGVDKEWADFLANAVFSIAQAELGDDRTLFGETGRWLKEVNQKYRFHIVDIPLYSNRQLARHSVSEYYLFFKWCQEFKQQRNELFSKNLSGKSKQEILKETADFDQAQTQLETALSPLTKEVLNARFESYFVGPETPPIGSKQRLDSIRSFFKGIDWKSQIMSMKLDKSNPLNRKVDNLRRELLAHTQIEFLKDPRFAKYGADIETILFIGSAGDKYSIAYKMTDSDVDFTILVKRDVSDADREALRQDFLIFFQEQSGGITMEGMDMSIMVDPMPKFYPTGESIPGFIDTIRDPAKGQELKRAIEATLDQLLVNASDRERYLDRGNLFRHNLFVLLGGYLKQPIPHKDADGLELAEEPGSRYDELFGDVPLSPWMAFDVVMGNMGYVFQHAMEKPTDMLHYQKVLAGKYPIRGPLFGLLLMSPKGRERLSHLSREEINAKGWEGAERIIVEIAKEILAEPNGMRNLDLPTTLRDEAGQRDIPMTAKDYERLFDEWILRKEGRPIGEVVGKPRGLRLESDHHRTGVLVAENIIKTEALFKNTARKTLLEQATALKELSNAAKDALAEGDRERQEIIHLKMKEIILSQAAVWNRMSKEQQSTLLKEVPPESDWLLAIAAVEGLNQEAGLPGPTAQNPDRVLIEAAALRRWEPYLLLDEPLKDNIARQLEGLRRRANEPRATPVLNSKPQTGG